MAKITLNDVTNILTAGTVINNNSQRIEDAIENTLSRDGTSPNEMNAPLDMNNEKIYNLPEPQTDTEPMRKGDIDTLIAAASKGIIATKEEAEAGVNNTKMMTPLRSAQAISTQAENAFLTPQYTPVIGSPALKLRDMNEPATLHHFDTRVGTNNPTIDTAAMRKAIAEIQLGNDFAGRKLMLKATLNPYRLGETISIGAYNGLINLSLIGEGEVNTRLSFTDLANGESALTVPAGSHFHMSDLGFANGPGKGIVIGEGAGFGPDFTTFWSLNRPRVQGFADDSYYFKNVFMGSLNNLWAAYGDAHAFHFAGGHTTISAEACWATHHANGAGWLFDGLGMIQGHFTSCGSDFNKYGFLGKNLQSTVFTACSAESCVEDAWRFEAGTSISAGVPIGYQDVGVTLDRCFGHNNNVGAVGGANLVHAISLNSRPIRIDINGPNTTDPAAYDLLLDGNVEADVRDFSQMRGLTTRSNNAVVVNSGARGKSSIFQLAASQSVASDTGDFTNMVWDSSPVFNSLGFTTADAGISLVVPANVYRVRITVGLQWDANVNGFRYVVVSKNGGYASGLPQDQRLASGASPAANQSCTSSAVIEVSPGDKLRVGVMQNSGSGLSVVKTTATSVVIEAV